MTTNKITYNSQLYVSQTNNDDNINKLLAIDNLNNIKYISTTRTNPNQPLFTYNFANFNTVITKMITSSDTYNKILLPYNSTAYYFISDTTVNGGTIAVLSVLTNINTNNLVYADVSSKDSISGSGVYIQTKMIPNVSNTITNNIQMENLSNKSANINSSDISINTSGRSIVLQLTGVAGRTIKWSGFLRITTSYFM